MRITKLKTNVNFNLTSHTHKFNLFAFTKCATETLETWFVELELGKDFVEKNTRKPQDVHDIRWGWKFCSKRKYTKEYYTAAVVRNPFHRIVSCYFDRISNPKARQYDPTFTSFKQWVLQLDPDPKKRIRFDNHWKPMTCEFQVEDVIVDQFIQLENFQEDMDKFLKKVSLPGCEFKNRKASLRLYKNPYQQYYDKEIFDHAAKLYAEDLELLSQYYSSNYEDYKYDA
jgi:hypothetical protein